MGSQRVRQSDLATEQQESSSVLLLVDIQFPNTICWKYFLFPTDECHHCLLLCPLFLSCTAVSSLLSHSVVPNSLWPHELQHTRLPCPSPSPRACSNSCPLSQWCHPTFSSSITCFSSYPQSFWTSGSFQMSWLFASGGQSIGASVSTSVLPMDIQGCSLLGLTGLISLLSEGHSRVFSSTTVWKHQFSAQAFLWSNSHIPT